MPGIEEDPAIRALDNIAAEYVSIRDQRMALNQDEHTLKQNALTLMRRYGKTIYRHEGIEIKVVPGEEDIKVKIAKPDAGKVEAPSDAGSYSEGDAAAASETGEGEDARTDGSTGDRLELGEEPGAFEGEGAEAEG